MRHTFQHHLEPRSHEYIQSALQSSLNAKNVVVETESISFDCEDSVAPDTVEKHVQKLVAISRSIHLDTLFEHDAVSRTCNDPMPELNRTRQTVAISPGLFTYSGFFLEVFTALERIVFDIANKHAATEVKYPPLWPVDLFRRIKYAEEFPQFMFMAAGVKEAFADKQAVADTFRHTEKEVTLDSHFSDSAFGLEPAVCDLCYYSLKESTIGNSAYTVGGPVFRNELSSENALDRLTGFWAREIMFLGEKEYVLAKRQELIEDTIEFVTKLDLMCRIETANDPFFGTEASLKNAIQYAARLKYEIIARMHSDRNLAVGSINYHMDFFGRAFNIALADSSSAHSMCLSFGLDRLTYALFTQYGCNKEEWPAALRTYLGI